MEKEMMQTDKLYFDRDLDWLAFNERVLQEAEDDTNPLYERLTFLAIFSSNLDEFFRVRVSKLRQIGKVKKSVRQPLALKPNKTLKTILKKVDEQQERFGKVYSNEIIPGLNKYGIEILEFFNSFDVQRAYMADYFHEKIKPVVEMIDSKKFTQNYFKDGVISLVVCFKDSEDLTFLSVPNNELGRFLKLPSESGFYRYIFLEDILKGFAQNLFPDKTVGSSYSIKVSRDASSTWKTSMKGIGFRVSMNR